MFAGAAREAVFANPEVAARIKQDFIPVALKAGLVNNPGRGPEGQLYREIRRTRPAPQGICAINSSGKVLAWALMFDKDESVLAFLDHCQRRFQQHPDDSHLVAAERFMRFPGHQLPDVADTQADLPARAQHTQDECPTSSRFPPATLQATVVGRAFDERGEMLADTNRQENYVEDVFEISPHVQRIVCEQARQDAPFPLPTELAQQLVAHAYLGQLDVNPLGGASIGGKTTHSEFQMTAQKLVGVDDGSCRLHVRGRSAVAGQQAAGGRSDGRRWGNRVELSWEGFVDLKQDRITRLIFLAKGREELSWGNMRGFEGQPLVSHLPAGRPIKMSRDVRFGIEALGFVSKPKSARRASEGQ